MDVDKQPFISYGKTRVRRHAHVVDGVLQVQDAVLDGVADVILRVGRRRRDLLVGTALG